jgi:hypothetical protein
VPEDANVLLFASVAGAFLAGFYVERWRARLARQRWKGRQQQKGTVLPLSDKRASTRGTVIIQAVGTHGLAR